MCQVTRVELNGAIGYVRENLQNISGIHVSSSHRLGITGGVVGRKVRPGSIPKHAVQVLELAAPDEVWSAMSIVVKDLDCLKRLVVRSRNWTIPKALSLSYSR